MLTRQVLVLSGAFVAVLNAVAVAQLLGRPPPRGVLVIVLVSGQQEK